MRTPRLLQSVVTRLVACLVVGGLVISAGLTVLELHRGETLLQMEITQQMTLTVRNLQSALRSLPGEHSPKELKEVLALFASDPRIRAVRYAGDGDAPVELGPWPADPGPDAQSWILPEHGLATGREVHMDRPTLISAPFITDGKVASVQLLVDGSAARRQVQQRVLGALGVQWLLMAVMTLLGLLLLRRWFTGPLSEVADLVTAGAGSKPFLQLSRRHRGEFAQLAQAIGGMLQRIDDTTEQLRQREQAFEDLYEFAPVAMLSLDRGGRIVEANHRAAQLLGAPSDDDLVGQAALEFIRPEDRGLLRQAMDRLDLDQAARCELRVVAGERRIDTVAECTGLRDEDGVLQRVRLSLQDVSQSRQLQDQLANQSRLLNLVIDHMSDAILLVDASGRIAAYNQQLAALLRLRPDPITGQVYEARHFWRELGVLDAELFVSRLQQIDADRERPAQERFETRTGTFLFEGIPMHDAAGQAVGRLWVVQEITPQEQSQRLLNQQTAQLQALRRLGQQLCDVGSVDELLDRAGEQLHEVFGVEAVGLALRRGAEGARSQQVLHRGHAPHLWAPNRALIEAVEQQLMPQVLTRQDVMHWAELPPAASWAKAFDQAGLTCLAGLPLRGKGDVQGILWIARRGGERLERHHLYLLEAVAPVIAAHVSAAELRERLSRLQLTDPVTDLPNREQFGMMIRKLMNRPGYPWSAVLVSIDRFRTLNDAAGHEAGDRLLAEVANQLRRTLRRSCLLARLTGPTFGILCPNMSREQAVTLAERVRGVLTSLQAPLPNGTSWQLSASIGLASCPEDDARGEAVADLAAARLETAKRIGPGNIVAVSDAGPSKQAG